MSKIIGATSAAVARPIAASVSDAELIPIHDVAPGTFVGSASIAADCGSSAGAFSNSKAVPRFAYHRRVLHLHNATTRGRLA